MANANINVPYYAARATEYDITSGYQRPTAAAAMAPICAQYQLALEGEDVLEVACGTGYWTRVIAVTARSVLATDVNPEVLAVLQKKLTTEHNVRFQQADAFTLEGVSGPFSAAIAQFWWSHIPKARLGDFLRALHGKLLPGARVMFLDSMRGAYRLGRRFDAAGDLLEERVLRNGTRYEIIKNFPTASEMHAALEGIADNIVFRRLVTHGAWMVSYRTKG